MSEEDLWRVLNNLDVGDCWEWKKSTVCGYGQFHLNGKSLRVHRIVYEALVGPIPEGMVLDHLCRNRKCANPDHLEVVTHGENIRRGQTGKRLGRRTHCVNGHSFENAPPFKNGSGRRCRSCSTENTRRARRKEKAS